MRDAEIQGWLSQHKNQRRPQGITALDMLELSPTLNQIMRVLLAHGPMTLTQLQATLAALPDTLWLDDSDLPYALKGLVEQGWILHEATDSVHGVADSAKPEPVYRVNLRTRARSSAATGRLEALDL